MVKIAFGSIGDSFSASSIKAYVAEFIATLLFVFAGVGSAIFAGVGSAIAYNKLTYNAALDPPGLVAVAVAHAFALFVGVSMAANIRGGHLNPAVTFGLAIGGNITILTGFFYWIAQCLGSTVACFLLQFVTNGMNSNPLPEYNIASTTTAQELSLNVSLYILGHEISPLHTRSAIKFLLCIHTRCQNRKNVESMLRNINRFWMA